MRKKKSKLSVKRVGFRKAESLASGRKTLGFSAGSVGRVVSCSSLGLIGILGLAMLFPAAERGVSAVDCTSESNPTTLECQMATSVNTNMATLVRSSLAVALSSRVDLDVTPKSTGAFSTSSADLKVTTNNTTGYAVYMQTGDNSSELKATNPHVDASIGPVEGTMSEGSYANNLNRWGYAVMPSSTTLSASANTEYKAVPQAGNEAIVKTTGISREDDYDLSFAVAVGSDLPAGLYTNQLLVSVVANPIEVRSLNDITYMQDMTAEICAITFEGETKQLVDSRDGKRYWVAKLKDGHCWMTQNLALDLEEGTTLTADDTDLANTESKSWTVPKSTETDIPLPNTSDNADTRSWNLGKLVLTKPTNSSLCPNQSSNQYVSALPGQKIEDVCSDQVVDVSNGWTDGYIATETNSIDETAKTYDAHYLFGNYYSWNAAVAGTGFTADGANVTGTAATGANGEGLTNATGSICPKGWQLPKAGRNGSVTETIFGVGPGQAYDIDGSFFHLLKTYGYNSGWSVNDGNGSMPIDHTDRTVNLAGSPIYFVRSGLVAPSGGSLQYVGRNGYGWSSTSYPDSSSNSYSLHFYTDQVFPSSSLNRYLGFPVRCLASW